jgi:tetratricopeptide (TPR) repeat protein
VFPPEKISFLVAEICTTITISTILTLQPIAVFALPNRFDSSTEFYSNSANFQQCIKDSTEHSLEVKKILCRANELVELGNKQEAIKYYSQALRLDPTNPLIYYQRAVVRSSIGDKEGAFDDYSQIIKLTPNYQVIAPEYSRNFLTQAYNERGKILLESRSKQKAVDDFTEAIKLNPDYGEPYRGRASALSALADLKKSQSSSFILNDRRKEENQEQVQRLSQWMRYKLQAEADYTSYLRFEPTDSDSYNKRGLIRYQIGQVGDDIRHLISNDIRFLLKNDIRYQGEYKKLALADYNQAIRLNPNFVQAYYNRAIVYDDLGYAATALDDYQRVLQIDPNAFLDPNTFITYKEQGIPHEQLMNENAAIDDYEEVFNLQVNTFITNNHPRARAYYERGIILARLGDQLIHSAEREVIPEESTIASYYCDASIKQPVQETQAYSEAKQYYDDAIKDFKEAIRYDSNLDSLEYARAFRVRGYIYSRQGKPQQAIQDFNQALYVDNKYAPAYFARGCVRAESGDYQKAIEDYNLAIRYGKGKDQEHTLAIRQDRNSDFDKAESYYHRGQAYAKLKQYQKAVQDYTEALEKYHLPQVKAAKYHYARGDAFYALKDYQQAKQDYTKYLSYNADAPGYREGNQIAEAYRKRADVRFELGETQGAIEDFNYYAEVTGDPQTAEVYFKLRNASLDVSDR